MQFLTAVAAALAASQTVSASATAQNTTCATPTATTTHIVQTLHCGLIACMKPTRTCAASEPTGLEPRPPAVFATVTPSPGACTAAAEAIYNPGCNLCPTCLPAVAKPTLPPALAIATPIF